MERGSFCPNLLWVFLSINLTDVISGTLRWFPRWLAVGCRWFLPNIFGVSAVVADAMVCLLFCFNFYILGGVPCCTVSA